jgi:hypothetical protein
VHISAFYLVLPSSFYSQLIFSCFLQFERRATSLLTKRSDTQLNLAALRHPTLEGQINSRKSLKSIRIPHFHSFLRPTFPYFPFKHQTCVCVCVCVCVCALAFVVTITKAIIAYTGNSVPPLACFVGYYWEPMGFILYFDGRSERDDYSTQ